MKNKNIDIDLLIKEYIQDYAQCGEPILVNFRKLIPEINKMERFSHLIHSYPAKLLCHIPYFFLKTDYFCSKGGVVLDPFCGTGTVLLEAKLASRNSLGVDANPLARMISCAKTTYICKKKLLQTLNVIIFNAKSGKYRLNPSLESMGFWFHQRSIEHLSTIIGAIKNIESDQERVFFEVCFSNVVKKVSYADPRISVPVKLNPNRFLNDEINYKRIKSKLESLDSVDVYSRFEQISKENIDRLETLSEISNNQCTASVIAQDARHITSSIESNKPLPDGCVDLILTSPPYAGAQKYIRSSSLNLGWLGLASADQLRELDKKNIGRENYRKSDLKEVLTGIKSADALLNQLFKLGKYERAHIVGNYIVEMKAAIDESIRVLKKGGYFIMIIGNNNVCGLEFNTQEYLTEYMISRGLHIKFKLIDDIKSYGLMTKRNKTASRISCEWVLVFKK